MLVAKCMLHHGTLLVESVLPARQLPGGGLTPAEATAAVRKELLGAAGQVVVGVDSPPAIAAEFMGCSWLSWAQNFSTTYDTPEAFREATSVAGEGRRREPKRQTDVVHKTPLPPQNLRMYKQTWWAIHGIFAPLSLGQIVDAFSSMVGMKLLGPLVADPGADSLDAVLAALGAACSVSREDFPAPEDGKILTASNKTLRWWPCSDINRFCQLLGFAERGTAVQWKSLLFPIRYLLQAHVVEEVFGCRKWCSQHLDFTGDALLHGKLWVLFSSSFFHGTHSHLLREVFLMILAGVPVELELGTPFFVVVFLISGAVGCSCSWLTLRRSLRQVVWAKGAWSHPDFGDMPREHVDAIANLSNSRGASACVYGTAVLAILLCGDEGANVTVSKSLLFWFFWHCLLRAYPSLLALGPPREFAATDYVGHLFGALAAVLAAMLQIFSKLQQGLSLQSILALVVLCISTRP
eukprot:Skav218820  [mRNA]  locus=scaffold1140:555924:563047:+ [translate_table: standard]